MVGGWEERGSVREEGVSGHGEELLREAGAVVLEGRFEGEVL
jgi:hypothetical protein